MDRAYLDFFRLFELGLRVLCSQGQEQHEVPPPLLTPDRASGLICDQTIKVGVKTARSYPHTLRRNIGTRTARCPDLVWTGCHPAEEAGTQIGVLCQSCHVRNITHVSDKAGSV